MTRSLSDMMRRARSLVSARRLDEATSVIVDALSGRRPEQEATGGPGASHLSARLKAVLPHGALRPAAARARQAPLPEGASFETRTYSGPQGSRAYKLYVPSGGAASPRPLIVMLHGCTQDSDDFAIGTGMNALAEAAGALVAYPEQTGAANAQRCWNWFDPAHQRRDAGEPAIIAGIVREVASAFEVDGTRVCAAGLSAGGAMAAVLGATYPDVFSAVGVHSGLPHGAAADVMSALSAMRSGKPARGARAAGRPSRMIVFHGDGDRTVHPANGEAVAGIGRDAAKATVKRGSINGRAYTRIVRPAGPQAPSVEYWTVEGLGHAWSGGDAKGSHTDPAGPDASREMMRFFLAGTA